MKAGKDITDLAKELAFIRDNSRDLIVPTASMSMELSAVNSKELFQRPMLNLENGDSFDIKPWAHSQIATYSNIPKGYYDRIQSENQMLLSACVNHGFLMAINSALAAKRPKHDSRLLRTVNGQVRGFLSDRYRILDCYELFETVAPILVENQFEVKSAELTEQKMYIKAVTPKIEGEIKPGHTVQYGIMISSSDVGSGSVRIEPLMYELVCSNGMIMEQSIKKMHVGKSQCEDAITELLTDETKAKADEAFWMSVRDTVKGTMQWDVFERNLDSLRRAADMEITSDVPKIVELSMKEVNIAGDGKQKDILNYLANGADGRGLNKWSLANAFTWAAQSDDVNFEESVELEKAGAKIIELPKSRWEVLNKAA